MDLSNPALVSLYSVGAFVLLYLTLAKAVLPIWRSLRSGVSRASGALDNIGGRDPFIDPSTGRLVPGIPAIGERFTSIENKLDGLANTDSRLNNHDARLTAVETRLNDHETAIGSVIADKFESGANAALSAVEQQNKDVIDGEATE